MTLYTSYILLAASMLSMYLYYENNTREQAYCVLSGLLLAASIGLASYSAYKDYTYKPPLSPPQDCLEVIMGAAITDTHVVINGKLHLVRLEKVEYK